MLLARPDGARLYELSDAEFYRLDHMMGLVEPSVRALWVRRFLSEREPGTIYPPGSQGVPDGVDIDRAIGGNAFTQKWGRTPPPRG